MKNVLKISALVFLLGSAAGCVKTGSTSSTTTNISFVTLMNMASYSPATTIYFNSNQTTSAVSAGAYSASYSQIPAGAYDVQFRYGSDSVMTELASSSYDSLGFYTLIMYNTNDSLVKSMKITDDYSGLSASSANFRFFQLSPDITTVDLYLSSSLATSGAGRSLADNANYNYYNAFQALTPGSYNIVAKKSGTDSVIAQLNTVSFAAGNAYTIFLQGSAKNSSNPIELKVLLASY